MSCGYATLYLCFTQTSPQAQFDLRIYTFVQPLLEEMYGMKSKDVFAFVAHSKLFTDAQRWEGSSNTPLELHTPLFPFTAHDTF